MSISNPTTSTYTYIKQKKWVWLARLVWLATFLFGVGMLALATPVRHEILNTTCVQDCIPLQILPEGVEALNRLGLSLSAYATLYTVEELLLNLVFVVASVLIFWRKSDDWMAILVSLSLLLFGAGTISPIHALPVAYPAMTVPTRLLNGAAIASLSLLFYLFPTGRFEPRWMRIFFFVSLGWILIIPFTPLWDTLIDLIVTLIISIAGISSQVYRYRRVSTPAQRQQTKWVMLGFGVFFAGWMFYSLPLILFPERIVPLTQPASTTLDFIYRIPYLFFFSYVPLGFLPVAFTVSTLRQRLWDVDPILNRSLVYSSLTIVLATVFAGGFFGIRAILHRIGIEQDLIAAGVPLVAIILLFEPTRTRLRYFVDRRFYGIQLDYHQFAQRDRQRRVISLTTGDTKTSLGDYANLEKIGRGGMGEVYRGYDPDTGRMVAIKILLVEHQDNEELLTRFSREAQAIARLDHPHIVKLYETGTQGNTPYMIMEFIDGYDLSDSLMEHGHLSLYQLLPILESIAAALDYAHGQGVIHRDVKPGNVMIERDTERPVLMDFGIAQLETLTQLTGPGGIIGTLDYISPEQIHGSSEFDRRTDIYAFGVMTYQALTGQLPFNKNNPGATVLAHLIEPPPDPRDLIPDLPVQAAEAVMQAMAKSPEDRFDTVGDLVAQLAEEREPVISQ